MLMIVIMMPVIEIIIGCIIHIYIITVIINYSFFFSCHIYISYHNHIHVKSTINPSPSKPPGTKEMIGNAHIRPPTRPMNTALQGGMTSMATTPPGLQARGNVGATGMRPPSAPPLMMICSAQSLTLRRT